MQRSALMRSGRRPARLRGKAAGLITGTALVLSVAVAGGPTAYGAEFPWMDTSLSAEERTDLLLPEMTVEEKIALMVGDNPGPAKTSAYFNASIPRLGIPELRTADIGPGLRTHDQDSTYFPQNQNVAATWDLALAEELGEAVSDEIRLTRHNMTLGPNVDIVRNPWWARIGETYGEDPLLSGLMGASFTEGVQADGDVGVNMKHPLLYNQETNRGRLPITNSIADERTIREIYGRAFAPTTAQGLASVQCSFNRINGEHTCENGYILNQVLRNDLGFDGFVLSDFTASYNVVDSVEDGLDMDTGFLRAYGNGGEHLKWALDNGNITIEQIDGHVRAILNVYFKYGLFDNPVPDTIQPLPVEEHGALARKVEQQAITLLKNDKGVLPLRDGAKGEKGKPEGKGKPIKSIAVLGAGGNYAAAQCCAASVVRPTYEVTPLEGITNRAGDGIDVQFERATDPAAPWDIAVGPESIPSSVLSVPGDPGTPGIQAEYWNNMDFAGDPFLTQVQNQPAFDNGAIFPFAHHPDTELSPLTADAVRFTGSITPPATGEYRLSLSGFGTGQLLINGEEVVSFDHESEMRAFVSDPMTLTAGQAYEFELRYAGSEPAGRIEASAVRLGWVAPEGALAPSVQRAVELAKKSDVAVVVAGNFEAEQRDRGQLDLQAQQDELISAVAKVNPRTIVVLQTGGPVLMPWLDEVEGVVQAYFGGQEQGNAIADVLFGDVNPSGKLPLTYPSSETQATDVLGIENPALTSLDYDVEYDEGVFVGYRGYENAGADVLFPFGHGLSYTKFDYSGVEVKNDGDKATVSFTLKNSGKVAGSEVAQVYTGTLPTEVETAPKQLAGFAKVYLEPGESRKVTIDLACKSFAYWDSGENTDVTSEGIANAAAAWAGDAESANTDGEWVKPGGTVKVNVGSSVEDIRLDADLGVAAGTCSEDSDLLMSASH